MLKKRKKTAQSPFAEYVSSLDEAQQTQLAAYFTNLREHICLDKRETAALLQDFESALCYYAAADVPLSEALERLRPENLGGFYSRPAQLWYPLDDAAKIYPLSMRHGQMAVFRLAAYLKAPVVPELLQIALTFTVKRFPSFATTVKKGVFWHYLDATKRRYTVTPERGLPCKPLMIAASGSQSFRVQYFENRISVEYFHILTDATGGMVFLKTLLASYFALLGISIPPCDGVFDCNEAPAADETANAFLRAVKTKRSSGFVDKPAAQLGGALAKAKPCRVIHFRLDAQHLHAVAKQKNTTVTAYLSAVLFVAARRATDEISGSFNLQIPVNMRKFYPCESVRNFSMYCGIRIPVAQVHSVDALLPEITEQLTQKASKDAMSEMMHSARRLVGALRYIPLLVKAPLARLVYGYLGDKIFTNTLSNLGVVCLPQALAAQVTQMDFVLGTAITNRASCSLVTCGTVATLTVVKMTLDPSFEEAIAALLTQDGLPPIAEGSVLYAD